MRVFAPPSDSLGALALPVDMASTENQRVKAFLERNPGTTMHTVHALNLPQLLDPAKEIRFLKIDCEVRCRLTCPRCITKPRF